MSSKTARTPKTRDGSARPPADKRIAQLEILVDELVKDMPTESRVRTCMEAVGLKYVIDPIARMNIVLSELECVRDKGAKSLREKKREQEI